MAWHSLSCVNNTQGLVHRRLRRLYSLAHRFRYPQFDLALSDNDKEAWNTLRQGANGFLGNVQAISLRKLMEDRVTSYEKPGCNMPLNAFPTFTHGFLSG